MPAINELMTLAKCRFEIIKNKFNSCSRRTCQRYAECNAIVKDGVSFYEWINLNEKVGWDACMHYILDNTTNINLRRIADDYFHGYVFCMDGDIDGGKCFEIREQAIERAIRHFETR